MEQLLAPLLAHFRWRPSDLRISLLSGGLTNQNYRISVGNKHVVMRVYGKGTELLGIDRVCELHCSRVAASLGVGAEVLFANDVLMVTGFLFGDTLSPSATSFRVREVVAAIKKYHAGPEFPGVFSAFETVRRYAQLARERGVVFTPEMNDALQLSAQFEGTLWPPPRLVPCHNDLLSGNFIDDNDGLRIIDWEYAAMGDPFFDLGNFAANQELTPEGCELLLREYFGTVREEDLHRLQTMRRASDLREAFWGFLQSSISSLDFDYINYAQTYLNRARA